MAGTAVVGTILARPGWLIPGDGPDTPEPPAYRDIHLTGTLARNKSGTLAAT